MPAVFEPAVKPPEVSQTRRAWLRNYFEALAEPPLEEPGRASLVWGLSGLLLIAAVQIFWNWATWGDLSIDGGHEMYVPRLLAEGKTLYRDVWYHYGPAGPYLNALLFRLFGLRLEVLFLAGAFAAAGSALFLFLAGRQLSRGLEGWAAGAVLLFEAFRPGLFSFPLPYSFPSVYGCLAACALLWLLLRSLASPHAGWIFAGGSVAAAAALLKLEFGAACYAALALAIALKALTGCGTVKRDLALLLPGGLACAAVIGWMVSLRGVAFITQENIMSWPTSYFMRTYGGAWLAFTGFAFNRAAVESAALNAVFLASVLATLYALFCWPERTLRAHALRALLLVWSVAYFHAALQTGSFVGIFGEAFFPRPMVLYVVVAAALGAFFFPRPLRPRTAALLLMCFFAFLVAFRILLGMRPYGYSVYYNGPAVLAFLILAAAVLRGRGRSPRAAKGAAALPVLCVATAALYAAIPVIYSPKRAPLRTAHGTIMAPEGVTRNYEAAIAFLREKAARGEAVLVLPEDTSLYFLSDTYAPTRVYAFNPGILAPGRMTEEFFREIESRPVRYLLWSNRTYPEYGVTAFGRDFNQPLGDYLKAHYRYVGPLVPGSFEKWVFNLNVWERKDEGGAP